MSAAHRLLDPPPLFITGLGLISQQDNKQNNHKQLSSYNLFCWMMANLIDG